MAPDLFVSAELIGVIICVRLLHRHVFLCVRTLIVWLRERKRRVGEVLTDMKEATMQKKQKTQHFNKLPTFPHDDCLEGI